jgi:MraZ protein
MANDTKTTSNFCILSGNCEYKLDSQRRVAVPSDWRTQSPTGCFVLIPGRDQTLQLYTEEVYNERIGAKLNSLSPSNPADLKKLRQLGARTFKLQCDKQGRIQIPQILMDFAQLKESVAFIASGNFGQIMDGARWKAEFEAFNETGDSFLDVLD